MNAVHETGALVLSDHRKLDPRIGKLNGGRFYCFPHGYDKPEVVGSLASIEAALGLRTPLKTKSVLSDYIVTVTPRFVTYAGTAILGEYQETISARTSAHAIKIARERRTENEGRCAVPASFRARKASTD